MKVLRNALITALILLNVLVLPLSNVNAQSESTKALEQGLPAEIKDVPGLKAELKQYVQDPKSKAVKFEMILTSNVDSDRVRIVWEVKGKSKFAPNSRTTYQTKIAKGGKYSIPIEVIPASGPNSTEIGVSELFGKVEAFELGESFVVTVRKNFASTSDGEILPITDDYRAAKRNQTLMSIGFYIILALAIVGGSAIAIKIFLKWFREDDISKFDQMNRNNY